MNGPVICPHCHTGGNNITKHGKTRDGRQKYRCHTCRKQFLFYLRRQPIDEKTRRVIGHLLREEVSPAIIARAIPDVSRRWIYELRKRMRGNDRS
jgi:transposase-like protein